ncbi:MAG: hypothetical protein V7K42_21240 [Nostoc sp.]
MNIVSDKNQQVGGLYVESPEGEQLVFPLKHVFGSPPPDGSQLLSCRVYKLPHNLLGKTCKPSPLPLCSSAPLLSQCAN